MKNICSRDANDLVTVSDCHRLAGSAPWWNVLVLSLLWKANNSEIVGERKGEHTSFNAH